MLLYFAYGSNMSRARLEARVGAVLDHGRATLSDYRHRFSKHGVDGTGKGNIEDVAALSEAARVWGVLYSLTPGQFEVLAGFETGYRPVQLPMVRTTREHSRVHSFVALEIVEGLRPTAQYLEHYRRGMHEHGIPEDYMAEILAGLAI